MNFDVDDIRVNCATHICVPYVHKVVMWVFIVDVF